MSKKESKQTFLGGAAILAAAVVIVKLIGAIFRIPLTNIIGTEGKAHFMVAYNIYNVLLTISTAGLPLAISKLTSEAHTRGRENEKRKLFRTAIWLFFALGLVFSLFMFFGAAWLAGFQGDELAYWPIRALAPAVFCVCLLACMRGYTQGQGNMKPTAVSQVLEALCKLGIGLPLAYYLYRVLGKSREIGAAGAILGVTAGTVLSMFFLIVYLMTHRDRTESLDVPESGGTLMRKVLSIGVPITLSNSAMSIITLIDQKIVLGRLNYLAQTWSRSALGGSSPTALYGRYSMGMDLINLPASFVYPVTMSLLPFAAAALARHDSAEADRTVTSAFRLIALLALPCGVGLSVLSTPILTLLYPALPEDAAAAGPLLGVLGIACIFICIMILTNAVLQSYGHEAIPIFTVIAGGIVKVVMNYFLVGNPRWNIAGAPVSTLCCYVVVAGLNLFFVWKYSPQKPRYLAIFAKPVLASLLMGAAAGGMYSLLGTALRGRTGAYLVNAVSTLGGIAAGVAVYFFLVLALHILRADDVRNMRGGEKLIRMLHLK
ncbi:MAG: polysaccharide biosynthesis protein [Oscillibacter sp.]|jgi:stage V sporulation protein B|nr:polysaccharide biosynthesis protein [Oscillibacter sp.]